MSPLVNEKAAAGVFLNSDPGDEIANILNYGNQKGKTTKVLRDLYNQVSKDTTGKAKKGLKNAVANELINYSRKSTAKYADDVADDFFISGKDFLKRLQDIEKPLVNSGVMTKSEVGRLKRIGQAFKKIEREVTSGASERIMTDKPGTALEIAARLAGAGIGGRIGSNSMGGSIQMAGIVSGFGKNLVNKLTKDEARELLIKATRDEGTMKMLARNASKLSEKQQMSLSEKIINEAKSFAKRTKKKAGQKSLPYSAVVPSTVTAGKKAERDTEIQSLKQKINNL
jgi:hypothetical protein